MLDPSPGTILIAEPFLGDPNFERSVILLADHNEDGSVGYVLNRPLEMNLEDLIPDFPEFQAKVFNGGPVQQDNLYFIHCRPDLFDSTIGVNDNLFWGGRFERLKEVVESGELKADEILFFLGYSGWGKHQLEEELADKSWFVVDAKNYDIFHANPVDMWRDVLTHFGGENQIWANSPSDPLMN